MDGARQEDARRPRRLVKRRVGALWGHNTYLWCGRPELTRNTKNGAASPLSAGWKPAVPVKSSIPDRPRSSRLVLSGGDVLQDLSRLALQRAAERIERREADRARLVGLQDRQIGERDVDAARQF